MSALSIQPTYPIFTDIDGQPLEAGYVWIGTANLDPQTNPINVYWDAALTILAPQPIRTLAGYPSRNGTPARLYVNSDYSIRVMNKNGSTVYSAPEATERYGNVINASTIDFLQAGIGAVPRTVQDKLREPPVSIEDFGAVADGNLPAATNNYAAFALAIATGKDVYVPDGEFMVDLTGGVGLTLNVGQAVYGNGNSSKILLKNTGTILTSFLLMESDCAVHDLNFDAYNTNASFVDDTTNTDPLKNFDYNNYLIAVTNIFNATNLRIQNNRIAHLHRGMSFGNATNLIVTGNYIYQIGEGMTQFYICYQLTFANNICTYGGGFGGVAASSVKKAVFANNVVISVGTGINTGGSPDPLYNVEEVSITGNWVMSRDCIVCENGIVGVAITGNYCNVLRDTSLPFQNGNGIACTSDSSGTAAGKLGDVTIVGNTIVTFGGAATGILIGSTSPSFPSIFGVVVSNNIVKVGNQAIYLRLSDAGSAMNDVVVSGNSCVATRGIVLDNVHKAVISNNVCKTTADIIVGNYYGIWAPVLRFATISDNDCIGFGYSVKIENVTEVVLKDNRTLPIPAGRGLPLETNAAYTGWFVKGTECPVTQTSTGTNLLLNSAVQVYSPSAPVVIPALLAGFAPSGETITIYFGNGNTTIQSGSEIVLRGGITINPSVGNIVTFVKLGAILYETSRNF
jgi:hypothetical protein